MNRILQIIILLVFLPVFSFAQLEKGDWLLDFQLNATQTSFENSAFQDLIYSQNFSLTAGRFWKKNLVIGLNYSMNSGGIKRRLNANNFKLFTFNEIHTFGTFARYYFGNQPQKKLLFVKSELNWQYEKSKSSLQDNDFLKRINLNVGMGLSLFKFPNAAFEMWIDYNLLRINTTPNQDNARFGYSSLIFQTAFQIYLNQNFQSKWAGESEQFLEKGKRIFGGSIKYDDLVSGIFPQTLSIDITPSYGKFVAARFLIGAELPMHLDFFEKDLDFNVGFGPFFRYYQPVTERFQVFGHLGFTGVFVGQSYDDRRTFEDEKWTLTKEVDTTCGLGLNYFLNKDLSIFWLYKYQFLQEIKSYNVKIWNEPEGRVGVDMGLVFYF